MTRVVIDPGHGGADSGATSGENKEKTFTLSIGLAVRDYLQENYQTEVLMTRTTDKTVSLKQRTDYANSKNADYFCSIHINAGGGTGWESYIFNGGVSEQTVQAQKTIHSTVISELSSKYGIRNRGRKRANFHVLRETRMPAILLENLFIDTPDDLKLLKNNTFTADLAHAIGKGIAHALSLKSKNPGQPDPGIHYKVIAGSFKNRQNALARVNSLQKKGIESFIDKRTVSGETRYRVQAGAFHKRANAEQQLKRVKAAGITDAYILEDR